METPASLYYEPHCDFDAASVAKAGPVDVVVSPVQSVLLGGCVRACVQTQLAARHTLSIPGGLA